MLNLPKNLCQGQKKITATETSVTKVKKTWFVFGSSRLGSEHEIYPTLPYPTLPYPTLPYPNQLILSFIFSHLTVELKRLTEEKKVY